MLLYLTHASTWRVTLDLCCCVTQMCVSHDSLFVGVMFCVLNCSMRCLIGDRLRWDLCFVAARSMEPGLVGDAREPAVAVAVAAVAAAAAAAAAAMAAAKGVEGWEAVRVPGLARAHIHTHTHTHTREYAHRHKYKHRHKLVSLCDVLIRLRQTATCTLHACVFPVPAPPSLAVTRALAVPITRQPAPFCGPGLSPVATNVSDTSACSPAATSARASKPPGSSGGTNGSGGVFGAPLLGLMLIAPAVRCGCGEPCEAAGRGIGEGARDERWLV